ncbi:MAG: glycosyltransferase [Kangiellaceae bacterium]|nr:glycosyltransferase [Kangiellaceae bacterium]
MRNKNKPLIAMDLSTRGKGGGPYTSTTRIMSSTLANDYDFEVINYDPSIGRGVSLKRILNLRNQIKKIDPNIVHFTGLSLQGFHLAVACYLAGARKNIVTIRGTSTDAIYFNPIKRFLLARILEPLTLIIASKIVGVSDYVSTNKIAQRFKHKSFGTIYNFPPKNQPILSKLEYRKLLSIVDDDIVISSVGRITKEKGYHILADAITHFSTQPKVKFIIAGEGDYLEPMKVRLNEQVTSGQVTFLGYCDNAQDVNFSADIFVLPTLHETLSNALLEASKAGLPLIASDTGGVPEIVESGYNGELFPTGDVIALVNSMQKLIDNPELRRQYGVNALFKVNEKFSVLAIEKKLGLLYAQLLAN